MKNNIAILIPYFGLFPQNIDLTLYTMYKNRNIDWIFFTDNEVDINYDNIILKKMSFKEMQSIIENKIGTSLTNPYKLCDYKPLYGHIFSNYISKYSYWGYSDIDLIFGNINSFINDKIIHENDKILELGHFSIYKNNDDINFIYKKITENGIALEKMLNSNLIYVFDENYSKKHIDINYLLEKYGYKIYKNKKIYADLDIKYKNFYINNHIKVNNLYFEYENGKLFGRSLYNKNKKEEFLYVHLQQKKNIPILTTNYKKFCLTPKGFISNFELDAHYFYKFKGLKLFWYIKFRIKRKIKNIIGRVKK